jgi:hypothetical protein
VKISSLLKGGGGKEGHTKKSYCKSVKNRRNKKSYESYIWDLLENILS